MKPRALAVPLAAGLALSFAPSALADTAATFDGSTLAVQGDGAADTYTVTLSPGTAVVAASSAIADADGAGTDCTVSGTTLTCTGVSDGSFDAGDGADTITVDGGSGAIPISGGLGDDTIKAGNRPLTPSDSGGPGNDKIFGLDAASDDFAQEAGSDEYHGGTAQTPGDLDPNFDPDLYQRILVPDTYDASLSAQGVNVSLDGSANDGVPGENDNVGSDVEYVYGTSKDDTLTAGPNAAALQGKGGNDTLSGSPKPDDLRGEAGSDTLKGNDGDDYLADGDFTPSYQPNGTTLPDAGNDNLDGGAGNDILSVDRGNDDLVGGAGEDDVDYSRVQTQTGDSPSPPTGFVTKYAPLTVTLDDQANDGPTGAGESDNIHSDVEDVETGPADDNVTGSAASNVLDTGSGKDTIDGGGGSDEIAAGAGDDTVNAIDQVTDRIDCQRGNDTANVDLPGANPSRADVVVNCETIGGTALGAPVVGVPVPVAVGSPAPKASVISLGGTQKVSTKTFLKSYTLSTAVTTNQPATVAGDALIKSSLRAVGDLNIGSGKLASGTGTRTLKVKVASKYRSSVKRKLRTKAQKKKGIKIAVAVTVTNASGQQTTATRTFTVKG